MKILITGTAGFIGYHLTRKLSATHEIIGIDNLNTYYDVRLKHSRLKESGIDPSSVSDKKKVVSTWNKNYTFIKADVEDYDFLSELFRQEQFDIVIHLAAQAGVRYSLDHPFEYIHANVTGFTSIIECCRHYPVKHLLYASSSSVYGDSISIPFSEDQPCGFPVSLYAATKRSNELFAHTYSHLYHIPTTGMRFFTVYGPWGRPDMAPMIFAHSITHDEPLKIFNNGKMRRDFTYVADIVDAIDRLIDFPPNEDTPQPFHRLLNIGHSEPIELMDFIHKVEDELGKTGALEMCPMQPGDVKTTYADTTRLYELTGFKATTSLDEGIRAFIHWYKQYTQES